MVDTILPLVLEGATVCKNGKRLVGPVDLTLAPGGFTIVIGPNGSGKTTLLRMMHGIEKLAGGTVRWTADRATARRRQSFVFQTPIMLRSTVRANLGYPLRLLHVPRAQARARTEDWAARIGLAAALERPATVLSGGERQKLALARALIRNPDVLFLDEPCASLDGRATFEIEEMLLSAHADGTRVIMSTHDMGQARRLASEILFIHKGQVHEFRDADAFFTTQTTHEAAAFLKGDILK